MCRSGQLNVYIKPFAGAVTRKTDIRMRLYLAAIAVRDIVCLLEDDP